LSMSSPPGFATVAQSGIVPHARAARQVRTNTTNQLPIITVTRQ
jgi:hypothetical protein